MLLNYNGENLKMIIAKSFGNLLISYKIFLNIFKSP